MTYISHARPCRYMKSTLVIYDSDLNLHHGHSHHRLHRCVHSTLHAVFILKYVYLTTNSKNSAVYRSLSSWTSSYHYPSQSCRIWAHRRRRRCASHVTSPSSCCMILTSTYLFRCLQLSGSIATVVQRIVYKGLTRGVFSVLQAAGATASYPVIGSIMGATAVLFGVSLLF